MKAADKRFDIAIVGGGITGMSAALALVEEGARVRIFDADENAGSTTNAGSLHVQLQSRFLRFFPEQAPNVEASLPLYLIAIEHWSSLDQVLGGVELSRDGGLMVAETEEQLAFLHEKAEREMRKGLSVDVLDRSMLDKVASYFGPDVIGAEICHDEGKVNPLVANAKLRAHLERMGVEFLKLKVEAMEVRSGRVTLQADGLRADGEYTCEQAILAASWGTGRLSLSLGTPLPIASEPLHMNITEPADYAIRHLVQHSDRPITLKQFHSGQIVIGGGWQARFDDQNAAPEVIEGSLLGNVDLASRLVPGIGDLRLLRTWAGLNTVADGKTILGRLVGAERIIAAVGGDAGYTLGPAVGRAAADIALKRSPVFDPAPYSPGRFN